MRLLTTKKERAVKMPTMRGKVSRTALIVFPLMAAALMLSVPKGLGIL